MSLQFFIASLEDTFSEALFHKPLNDDVHCRCTIRSRTKNGRGQNGMEKMVPIESSIIKQSSFNWQY